MVSVLVSFANVQQRPTARLPNVPPQARTPSRIHEPHRDPLESVLGAQPLTSSNLVSSASASPGTTRRAPQLAAGPYDVRGLHGDHAHAISAELRHVVDVRCQQDDRALLP
jgi:hypothetical protein